MQQGNTLSTTNSKVLMNLSLIGLNKQASNQSSCWLVLLWHKSIKPYLHVTGSCYIWNRSLPFPSLNWSSLSPLPFLARSFCWTSNTLWSVSCSLLPIMISCLRGFLLASAGPVYPVDEHAGKQRQAYTLLHKRRCTQMAVVGISTAGWCTSTGVTVAFSLNKSSR